MSIATVSEFMSENAVAVIVCIAVLLLILLKFVFNVFFIKLKRWKNRKKGARGEKDAVRYLEKHGFEILEEQPTYEYKFVIDDELRQFEVQPDIIARKNGIEWVIEVKNGNSVGITKADTRRQIREYAACFPTMRCGFYDATRGTLHKVEFIEGESRCKNIKRVTLSFLLLLITFFLGVVVTLIVLHLQKI